MVNRFEKFTRDIAAASKCISKIKEHEMKRFGLHGGCLMCLFFIGRYPVSVDKAGCNAVQCRCKDLG